MKKQILIISLLSTYFMTTTRVNFHHYINPYTHNFPHLPHLAPQNNSASNTAQSKDVTFLVYIAADNSLYPFVDYDIHELEKIGSNKNVNILAYVCTKKPGQRKTTKKYEIRKGYAKQIGIDAWQDSGDYKTVIKACQWALSSYPADTFILDFWNHGSGAINRSEFEKIRAHRAVCYDDTTGNFLIDSDLKKIGQAVKTLRKEKNIDIVAFDACLMSAIEIAYILAPYATYMVASQETIPGNGFAYDQIAIQLASQKTNAKDCALNMVTSYQKAYASSEQYYTMSALDLSQVNALTENINQLSQTLITLLTNDQSLALRQIITQSAQECENFELPSYIDLGNFYANILKNIQQITLETDTENKLNQILHDGITLITSLVLSQVHGKGHANATGISIYFDQQSIDPDYSSLAWSQQTTWTSLLNIYLGA